MTSTPVVAPRGRNLFLAASLVLIAFNARPALSSLGPVLPEAMRDTGLSPASAGLLTTLPVLCLGLFGLTAPWFARRLGAERTVLAFTLVLAIGIGVRAFGTEAALVFGCALGGVGIGIVNVLLPGLIKREFPHAQALMMGLYTMALCAGAALAAGATVPLQTAFGGSWPWALAFWAVPSILAAALWSAQCGRRSAPTGGLRPSVAGLWREPLAWHVTLLMGLQSAFAYTIFAWLAPILRDRGLSPLEAGLVVSVSVLLQAPVALAAPILAARMRDQRAVTVVSVLFQVVGLAGCLYAPTASIWLWAVILAIGGGATFAIAMTLIVLRSADAPTAAGMSSMSQGIGYTLAAGGPLLMGLLRSWTGDFSGAGPLFFVIGAGATAAALFAGRDVQVRARPVAARPAPSAI